MGGIFGGGGGTDWNQVMQQQQAAEASRRVEEDRQRAEDTRRREVQLGLSQQTARRRGLGLRSLLGLDVGGLVTRLGSG